MKHFFFVVFVLLLAAPVMAISPRKCTGPYAVPSVTPTSTVTATPTITATPTPTVTSTPS
jgi:hypothetical protein